MGYFVTRLFNSAMFTSCSYWVRYTLFWFSISGVKEPLLLLLAALQLLVKTELMNKGAVAPPKRNL